GRAPRERTSRDRRRRRGWSRAREPHSRGAFPARLGRRCARRSGGADATGAARRPRAREGVVGVHTVGRALIGMIATLALGRLARRWAVAERLQSERTRRRLPRRVRVHVAAALYDAGVESAPEDAV